MSTLLHSLREAFRHDFGAAMFLLIAGLGASVFIGYLLVDFFKSTRESLQRKKKRRHLHRD